MLYESAARADEVLSLNAEDLYPQDKRGKNSAKGGATEWIHWQSGTAQLLPCLIARRTRGPLLLTDRKAPAGTPTLDVCPETGRARLSYRRAEENSEVNTRLPATRSPHPRTSRTWTASHDGTSTPMLPARSRPGAAVARHIAERDPAAQRHGRCRRDAGGDAPGSTPAGRRGVFLPAIEMIGQFKHPGMRL